VDHIQRFLLEMGAGFAFVGRQVPLEVGGQDFQISCAILMTSRQSVSYCAARRTNSLSSMHCGT